MAATGLMALGAVAVGAQDVYWEKEGAFTGEINAAMLVAVGVTQVIIGHSERRQYFGETDDTVNLKLKSALEAGLTPIVCVGETGAEREAGQTDAVVARQITGSLPAGFSAANTVIAYEPVWAIGTGKVATTADIAAVHAHIRKCIGAAGAGVRILYGGSVKGANAQETLGTPGVAGALVGGASLDLEDFWRIIIACPSA